MLEVSGRQEKTGKSGARASSHRRSQQPISVKALVLGVQAKSKKGSIRKTFLISLISAQGCPFAGV